MYFSVWAKASMVVRRMLVTGSAKPMARPFSLMQWAR
jgi:hypothetical protein